jgi:cell division protein FtsN
MRFEIKSGGIAAIFLAMALLSGAVFVLGLLAGYDVGRQSQLDSAQLATSFPLQTPPAADASPAAPMISSASAIPPGSAASTSPAPAVSADTNPPAPGPTADRQRITAATIRPRGRATTNAITPTRQRVASATIPPSVPSHAAALPAPDDVGAPAESEPAQEDVPQAARPGSQRRHKPYNIQIQAAMDINGADQMMARLQKLGYPSHLVPTEIAGQRWYKVEVGPYATQEEATDAEAELRQNYDSTYGGVARRAPAGQQTAGDDSEE